MLRSEFQSPTATTPRPPRRALPIIDSEAIPAGLRSLDQWVVWRRRDRDGKTTKVPYRSLSPSETAESDDPLTWSSHADAVIACADPKNRLDGIGFVFTADDPYCGIDLDKCLDARGKPEPWAAEILDALPCYAEVSPSGVGLKLFLRASVPNGKGRKKLRTGPLGEGSIEVYDRVRYFTVTGKVFDRDHAEMAEAGPELARLHAAWFPVATEEERACRRPQTPDLLTDRQLFDKATQALNGAKFTRLWSGNWEGYPSKSEADLALCSVISFFTSDPAVVERMFGQSGLVDAKWEARPDYRKLTVDKSMERAETYDPRAKRISSNNSDEKFQNRKNTPENNTNYTRNSDSDPNDPDTEQGEEPNKKYNKYSKTIPGVSTAREGDGNAQADPSPWLPPRLEAGEPAVRFPVHALPGPLAELAAVAGASLGCPVDFPAVAALGIASGAMGRSVVLRLKDGWSEAPAFYGALVGDPGMTKSPAVALMSSPLWKITREQLDRHKREVEQAKRAKDPDSAPAFAARIVVDEVTVERLAGLLAENSRGLVMVRDELSALFSGMNQYKAGGKGNDRQFYLGAWSGSPISVDRKHSAGQPPVQITHPFLSITGGMTPGMLGEMGEGKGRDDGLLDRFLFTCPEPVPVRWSDDGVPRELAIEWESAVRNLWSQGMPLGLDGNPRPHFVRFTPDAKDAYAAWFDFHNRESEGDDFPGYLKGPWSKMRAYCARLALCLDRLAWSFDPDPEQLPGDVGVDSLSRAIVLMDYFKSHTRRVRSMMVGTFGECPEARKLLRWARGREEGSFGLSEVRQNFRKVFPVEKDTLDVALRWLELRHCVRPAYVPSKSGPGRPSSRRYEVNPALLGDIREDD